MQGCVSSVAEIPLLNIELESDLSEFDGTVVNVNKLVQNGTSSLNGTSGGMEILLDATTTIYGEKLFTWDTDDLRFRFYFDPNSVSADTAQTDFLGIVSFDDPGGSSRIEARFFMNDAGLYQINGGIKQDSFSTLRTSLITLTDAPHLIEVHVRRSTSAVANDGFVSLYVDGVLQNTATGGDIFDLSRPDRIRIGAGIAGSSIDANNTGSIYLDEIALNITGTEIGN